MKMNLHLVRSSQFLQQLKMNVQHKLSKEHIIRDTLSCLASTNVGCVDPSYSELNTLFMYNMTLVKIHPGLVLRILADYEDNKYWARLHHQV